jgi:hypothetical protein
MTTKTAQQFASRKESNPLINPNSLSETLDAVNDALFHVRPIAARQKIEVAEWIAGRQGVWGSYMGMPAPTPDDIKNGMRVFTGEPAGSRASLCHVLGEEACRVLLQLGSKSAAVKDA